MSKHSQAFKLKVIQAYLSGEGGQRSVAATFNISRTQLREWLSLYQAQGAAGLAAKKEPPRYSTEFKLSVLTHRREHNLSLFQTAALFNIPSISTVYVWEQRYYQDGIKAFVDCRGRPKMKTPEDTATIVPKKSLDDQPHPELLREVKYLRAENAYLKKLASLIQKKQLQQKTKPTSSLD